MAHELYQNQETGEHSFFSVKEKAWHGLGKIVEDYPTSAEAIKFAGLDYEVEKRPLFTLDTFNVELQQRTAPDDDDVVPRIAVPDYYSTVRRDTDTVLGVVGADYQVVQNRDAFTFFDSIVGGDGIQFETAGALGKGERIFITAKLPGYINVGNRDLLEKYLFLTTSHDGLGSITVAFTPIRIVCANTLAAALRNMHNKLKIRHTANAKDRLAQAHKVMGISNNLSTELEQIFNQWSKVRVTDPELKKLIQLAMIPNKEVLKNLQEGKEDELSKIFRNSCDKIFEYSNSNPTQTMKTTEGTLFGVFNGITGYFQNVKKYKNQEDKVKSILLGGAGEMRTQRAFDLCLDFAQRGTAALNFN